MREACLYIGDSVCEEAHAQPVSVDLSPCLMAESRLLVFS